LQDPIGRRELWHSQATPLKTKPHVPNTEENRAWLGWLAVAMAMQPVVGSRSLGSTPTSFKTTAPMGWGWGKSLAQKKCNGIWSRKIKPNQKILGENLSKNNYKLSQTRGKTFRRFTKFSKK
jgi:hypothetical protein